MAEAPADDAVIVIGAGVVGVACAWALARDGRAVTVVDPDPPGSRTSAGNAGGIATAEILPISVPGLAWRVPGMLLDPMGPLAIRWQRLPQLAPWLLRFLRAGTMPRVEATTAALAALMAPATECMATMLAEAGAADLLQRQGALYLYRSESARAADAPWWALKARHGVKAQALRPEEIRQIEPDLSPDLAGAMLVPDWSHVLDPQRVVTATAEALERRGVRFARAAAQAIEAGPDGVRALRIDGGSLPARQIVLAAGAWSQALAAPLGDRFPLVAERGYHVMLAEPGVRLTRMLTFCDDSFVATPMAAGLRIGGTVELSLPDDAPNWARAEKLPRLAKRYLPNLAVAGGKPWSGPRPSTPDSRPVIGLSTRVPGLWHAWGHGHLGLTYAAVTGRLVADLMAGRAPIADPTPFRLARL